MGTPTYAHCAVGNDIDHFKQVNDKFGHQAGDMALQQVAEIIRQSTRKMDLVCRIGGEEFAVILPVTRNCESNQTAERIREHVESTIFRTQDAALRLTISVGVANAMKGDDAQLLFRRADTALYASKQRNRNCSTLHDGANVLPSKMQPLQTPATLRLSMTRLT